MRRENFQFSSSLDETAPSHLFLFYQFHYGRLLFMEATSVPCIHIIPIPSGNLLQQRREKRRRDWKRKRRRKEKETEPFVRRGITYSTLSRRMTYQPACPRLFFFFFFQFYSSSSNEKLTGSLPFYVRWGERERMFPREKQPEARAPPSLDIAIQPRWPRILVFHSSSRFHAHMDSLFVHGSCQFVAWKNASIVSRSRRTLDGWLGNHRTSNRWMLRKVGDLFERSSFEYVFPRFINDLNSNKKNLKILKYNWRYRKRSWISSILLLNKYRSDLPFSTRIDREFIRNSMLPIDHPSLAKDVEGMRSWLELEADYWTEGSVVGLPSFDFQETRNWRE